MENKIGTIQKKFNLYIKKRDMNSDGTWTCISCGDIITESKLAHAGHLFPRKWFSWLRFNEYNVNVQCASCNRKDGNVINYYLNLIKKIGKKKVDELVKESNIKRKISYTKKYKNSILKLINGS